MIIEKIQLIAKETLAAQPGHIFQLTGHVVFQIIGRDVAQHKPMRAINIPHLLPGLLHHDPLRTCVDRFIRHGRHALIGTRRQKNLRVIRREFGQRIFLCIPNIRSVKMHGFQCGKQRRVDFFFI